MILCSIPGRAEGGKGGGGRGLGVDQMRMLSPVKKGSLLLEEKVDNQVIYIAFGSNINNFWLYLLKTE